MTSIHTSVLIHPLIHLTSNKHHRSSQFSLWVVYTEDVGSRPAGQSLINRCSGITSPAEPYRVHDCPAVAHGTELLPFFHNATEGGVGPSGYNYVLGVHLVFFIAGDIAS